MPGRLGREAGGGGVKREEAGPRGRREQMHVCDVGMKKTEK